MMKALITAAWREADWHNKDWNALLWVAYIGVVPLALVTSAFVLWMFSGLYHDPDWKFTISLGLIGVPCAAVGTVMASKIGRVIGWRRFIGQFVTIAFLRLAFFVAFFGALCLAALVIEAATPIFQFVFGVVIAAVERIATILEQTPLWAIVIIVLLVMILACLNRMTTIH